ncbi:MAG: DUF1573 domain-containing protein [Planctomycetota bacterium]
MRFGIVFFLLLLSSAPAFSSGVEGKKLLKKEISLDERKPGAVQWGKPLDLGVVEPGVPIELVLKIKNGTSRTLRFDGFKTTCSCTVGSKIIEALKPGASATTTVTITPQASNYKPKGIARFSLYNLATAADRVIVDCDYTYRQFLGFSQPQYLVKLRAWEIPKSLEPVELPFRFTEPVKLDQVKVKGTGQFEEADLRIQGTEQGGVVRIAVGASDIPKAGMYGTVKISHPLGSVSECQLNISKMDAFDFSPERVSFVFDSESAGYAATGILKLNRNPNGEGFLSEEGTLAMQVSVKASFPCEVNSKMLDKIGRVHRIYLNSNVESPEEFEGESILLVFDFKKKKYTHKCKVRFIR